MWDRGYDDYSTLENTLFSEVKLVKTADIDQYKLFGYGIGFDRDGTSSGANKFGENVIIFGVDMSTSVHVDNKKQDILILGERPPQGLDYTTLLQKKSVLSILNLLY